MNAADFSLLNCTSCELRKDGGPALKATPQHLSSLLSAERSSTYEMRLINERSLDKNQASARFVARIRIPSDDALNAIDEEFVGRLAVEHPTITDVDDFRAACPKEAAAQDYAGALGDYVIGLAIKERHPDAGVYLEFEHYLEKFTAAHAILKEFRRPVAYAVSSVINFNLNNFIPSLVSSRVPILSTAVSFFRSISMRQEPPISSAILEAKQASVCPVDIVTHQILEIAHRLTSRRKPHPITATNLEELCLWEPLSEYDSTKLHVLAAVAHARLGEAARSEQHLRAIQFNFLFGKWAQARLDISSPHGRSIAT